MYEEEAFIHVICADVMWRSRPICAVITVPAPKRNEDIPIAIVAVRTKSISCIVDLKASGRPLVIGLCLLLSWWSTFVDAGILTSPMLTALIKMMSRFRGKPCRLGGLEMGKFVWIVADLKSTGSPCL